MDELAFGGSGIRFVDDVLSRWGASDVDVLTSDVSEGGKININGWGTGSRLGGRRCA